LFDRELSVATPWKTLGDNCYSTFRHNATIIGWVRYTHYNLTGQ
jgi:hypothetical protein